MDRTSMPKWIGAALGLCLAFAPVVARDVAKVETIASQPC